MAWVAVDKNGDEFIYDVIPTRAENRKWYPSFTVSDGYVKLPKGSIKKLINIKITWKDEPVELLRETNEN